MVDATGRVAFRGAQRTSNTTTGPNGIFLASAAGTTTQVFADNVVNTTNFPSINNFGHVATANDFDFNGFLERIIVYIGGTPNNGTVLYSATGGASIGDPRLNDLGRALFVQRAAPGAAALTR